MAKNKLGGLQVLLEIVNLLWFSYGSLRSVSEGSVLMKSAIQNNFRFGFCSLEVFSSRSPRMLQSIERLTVFSHSYANRKAITVLLCSDKIGSSNVTAFFINIYYH